MFSLPFPISFGVLIVGEGRVELCLRRVFWDPVSLGFGWIHLDSTSFHGLCSFYMPYHRFLLQGGDLLSRSQLPVSPGLH